MVALPNAVVNLNDANLSAGNVTIMASATATVMIATADVLDDSVAIGEAIATSNADINISDTASVNAGSTTNGTSNACPKTASPRAANY